MRPLRIQIEGFTAFKNPVDLCFEELDLFAITGPTGAGKSSLIDAISYALYGRVPRVTNEVSSCISLGMDRMQVALEFTAGEDRLRIHRETRRKGAPNVRLERWRDGDWQPVVDRARDVNEKVAEIVGLDYDGFTRSVILPQGQFQEFLAGSAEKRRAVLRSLLRLEVYDRMRSRASGMERDLKTRIEERQRELDSLAEATPENLRRLDAELEAARQQVDALGAQLKRLEAALERTAELSYAWDTLVRCDSEAASATRELEATGKLVDEGDAAVAALDVELQSLESQLAANTYDSERHTALRIALDRVKVLAQTRAGIEQATKLFNDASKQAAGAGAAVEKTKASHQAAEEALRAAEAAYNEAQRHDLAASVRQGLKPGDACPVCGGTIGEVPESAAPGLDTAQKKLAAARKAEADARNSFMTASSAAASATTKAESAQSRLQEFKGRVAADEAAVAEVLPAGQDASVEAVTVALAALAKAQQERQALVARIDQVRHNDASRRAALDEARRSLAALEQRGTAATSALKEAQARFAAAQDAVLKAVGTEWPQVAAGVRENRDTAPRLRNLQAEAVSERGRLERSIGQIEARIERMKHDMEKAEGLRKGLDGIKKERDVAADLAQMLGAGKFQTFLQYEALHTLARDGSRRLETLSNGRYKLQVDDKGAEFEVVDQWNADQARSVKTLSGGETFLASLALSLALAESLPGLAASRRVVLESIFLDEGFGSLDAEALDRAADALDALRDEHRMVCIVTHLQELAQRLPARVVVTRSESGSSVGIA